MLDCVTARRPTPPAYSAGQQCGLWRSRRLCARRAELTPPSAFSRSFPRCLPLLFGRPSAFSAFGREILSDRPLSGAALRMCMLFLGRRMLSCCCCQQFLCFRVAASARLSLPLPHWQCSRLPLKVDQAGVQGPHSAPPGVGTSAVTLLAVQLATQPQCATSQTFALNVRFESAVSYVPQRGAQFSTSSRKQWSWGSPCRIVHVGKIIMNHHMHASECTTVQCKKFKWSHHRNGRYTPGAPLRASGSLSFATQHVQPAEHVHTHRTARGDVTNAVIPVNTYATAAQWRSEQHTQQTELTLHRVRVGPRRHANTRMAPGSGLSSHYRTGDGRAARVAQARSSG
jgi:hypothetical protein